MRTLAAVGTVLAMSCGGGSGDPPPADAPIDGSQARTTVFLEFDGVTLTAGPDNATTNTSQIIQGTQTMTPFADDHPAERDVLIGQVTSAVTTVLQPFAIDVVTTRPATGPYTMLVFGGASTEVGLSAGIGGLAASACQAAPASPIVLLFADIGGSNAPGSHIGSSAVAGLAISHGVVSADLRDDCTCWAGTNCGPTALCTFGGPGTPVATNDPCAGGRTTMDPRTEFGARFGFAP